MTNHLDDLLARYPELTTCSADISSAFDLLLSTVESGGRILLCGNGGSAADADHIAGELLKGFVHARPISSDALPGLDPALARLQGGIAAIPLTGFPALRTAVANDTDPALEFAQLVWALGQPGDVLWSLTCSGNARNVLLAMQAARGRGLKNLLFTGGDPGSCVEWADVTIRVPDTETYRIQERHLPIYHGLCLALEEKCFG